MREEFAKRYRELGGNARAVKIPRVIRTNKLRSPRDGILERLESKKVKLTKISYLEHGYEAKANFSLGSTPEYLQGYYYLQGAAAQLPVQLLDVQPGDIVLDACASPGGKSTQIAQGLKGKGILICIEKKEDRNNRLGNNLERMGVTNTLCYWMDARNAEDLDIIFDKVLIDAPCSGNYTQQKDWFLRRTLEDVKEISKVQKQILKAGIKVLKKGGTLVYSTCSLEPEENEQVIDWAIKNFDVKLIDSELTVGSPGVTNVFGQKLDSTLSKTRRFWPSHTKTEGFFVACLKRF
jgi:tRNA (cytosine40_48-C5)-methyltransferase